MKLAKLLGPTAGLAAMAIATTSSAAAAASVPVAPANAAHMADFGTIVGNARTVIYGEDSHGMQRIHELVPDLFRTLVEKNGHRVFVFEVQWGVTEGLADFMASDRTELGTQENYWLNGAFASKPVAAMLVWIRDWNRRHPADQIQIAGYQPEQPVTDFRVLLAHVDMRLPDQAPKLRAGIADCRAADSGTYKTELDFIMANAKFMREGKPAFTATQRESCLSGLKAIDEALAAAGNDKSVEGRMARLHSFSLTSYFSTQRKLIDTYMENPDAPVAVQRAWSADVYGRGDGARYVIYKELKDLRFPHAKVFHWMHNWHAFRHASEVDGLDGPGGAGIPRGTKSFGERLAADEKSKLRVFATVVPCGTSCKDKEPENSSEPLFAQVFGDKVTVIYSRNPAYTDRLALDQPRALWANQHRFGFRDVVLARQADGIFYLPKSDPVR
jgi:erythromycin esterase-like protein